MYLLALLLVLWTLSVCKSLVIDEFIQTGSLNKRGLERGGPVFDFQPRNLVLGDRQSLWEVIEDPIHPIDMSGKSILVTYSNHIKDQTFELTLQSKGLMFDLGYNLYYEKMVLVHLSTGTRKQVSIPVWPFRKSDLKRVHGLVIFGKLTIHKLEIVENTEDLTDSSVLFPSIKNGPVLLINDFRRLASFGINSLNYPCKLAWVAGMPPNSFNLAVCPSNYIQEQFAPESAPLNMRFMAVRITYSVPFNCNCKVSIIHPRNVGTEISGAMFKFISGQHMTRIISVSEMMETPTMAGYAIKIQRHINLHRIELIMDDIKPLHRNCVYFENALQLLKIPNAVHVKIENSFEIIEDAYKFFSPNQQLLRMDLHVSLMQYNDVPPSWFYERLEVQFSDPENLLFEPSGLDSCLGIIPNAQPSTELLDRYKFFGQVLGMAALNKQMQSLHLSTWMHKLILGLPIDETDTNTILSSKHMTVCASDSKSKCVYRLIGLQAAKIKSGFHDVIPKMLVAHLEVDDLMFILNGNPVEKSTSKQVEENVLARLHQLSVLYQRFAQIFDKVVVGLRQPPTTDRRGYRRDRLLSYQW